MNEFRDVHLDPKAHEELTHAVRLLIQALGEDPNREGLQKTPERVARALLFLTKGYHQDPSELFKTAVFEEPCDEMIVVKDIDFYALCEHHLLPFFGKCHIAYIPNKKIVGLSKLARLVEIYSRRLQVQERMTNEIAYTLQQELDPLGVGVVIEAQHLCMMMRGVEKQNSYAITSAMLGAFRTNIATRSEFFGLIRSMR